MADFEIDADRVRGILKVTYKGVLTLASAKAIADRIGRDPTLAAMPLALLDFSAALLHEIDIGVMKQYNAYKTEQGYPTPPTAVVVTCDEIHIILAKLISTLRTAGSGSSSAVFTNQDEAVSWLLEQRGRTAAVC